MKISILIPTHNRAKLFSRCIQSVFAAYRFFPVDLEIIVNNDTHDITEEYYNGITVKYHYVQNNNLGEIYKFLFDSATKEYVYYLEDDDYLNERFFFELSQYDSDIFYFNYVPYKVDQHFIKYFNYASQHEDSNKDQFLKNFDDFNFQFGQICFKKAALPNNAFPVNNYIKNDFVIFKTLVGSFKALDKYLYRQTVDGQDNISFKAYNKDARWIG